MLKALVLKELRESAGLLALAVLGAAYGVAELTGVRILPWAYTGSAVFPFANDGLKSHLWLVAGGLAIALGLKQSVWESWHDSYYFLLQRPLTRRAVFGTKLTLGTMLVLLVSLGMVLLYATWASTPGTHPTPFLWSMTVPAWQRCLSLPLVYLGAFLSGIRPGRWFGSRLFPLAGSIALVPFADAMPWRWLWLVIVLVVAGLEISSILWYVEERDF